MQELITEGPVLDEKIWNAWLLKGGLQDRAEDRKIRILGGIALAAVGSAVYFFALR